MISKEQVKSVATLAKIVLSEDEIQIYANQLASIFDHFQSLQSVGAEEVEPLLTPFEEPTSFREDLSQPFHQTEKILGLTSDRLGELFRVPPAI